MGFIIATGLLLVVADLLLLEEFFPRLLKDGHQFYNESSALSFLSRLFDPIVIFFITYATATLFFRLWSKKHVTNSPEEKAILDKIKNEEEV